LGTLVDGQTEVGENTTFASDDYLSSGDREGMGTKAVCQLLSRWKERCRGIWKSSRKNVSY
jgi:hypothetical protein